MGKIRVGNAEKADKVLSQVRPVQLPPQDREGFDPFRDAGRFELHLRNQPLSQTLGLRLDDEPKDLTDKLTRLGFNLFESITGFLPPLFVGDVPRFLESTVRHKLVEPDELEKLRREIAETERQNRQRQPPDNPILRALRGT